MSVFLDKIGLSKFFQGLKNIFVQKEEGKDLSTEDFTTPEKEKLAGLNNYELPTATDKTLGGVKVGEGLTIKDGVLSATGQGTTDITAITNEEIDEILNS